MYFSEQIIEHYSYVGLIISCILSANSDGFIELASIDCICCRNSGITVEFNKTGIITALDFLNWLKAIPISNMDQLEFKKLGEINKI